MRFSQVLYIPSVVGYLTEVAHPAIQCGEAIEVSLGIAIGCGASRREDLISQCPQAEHRAQGTIRRLELFREIDEMGVLRVDELVAQPPRQCVGAR